MSTTPLTPAGYADWLARLAGYTPHGQFGQQPAAQLHGWHSITQRNKLLNWPTTERQAEVRGYAPSSD